MQASLILHFSAVWEQCILDTVCLGLHVYLTGSQYTYLLYGKMAIR